LEEKRRKGKLKRSKGCKKGWERVGWRSKRIEKEVNVEVETEGENK
jgi:hypothetical protein